MTKIKFIEARFFDDNQGELEIRRRFERHLREMRAVAVGVSPPAPDDVLDRMRWESDLSEVPLAGKDTAKLFRRARKLNERRAAASGLQHLKSDDKKTLEVLRDGVRLVPIRSEHHADEIASRVHVEMPWMSPATDILWKAMRRSVRIGEAGFHLPPLLLDGPPGIGKSMWARQLGNLIGVPRCGIEATSETASFGITGCQRGWGSAVPGRPLQTILNELVANPIVVVDEVEKAGTMTSSKGHAHGLTEGLLSLLEPSSAASWKCPYFQVGFDMSWISWVLTSNTSRNLPEPLMSRLEVVHLPSIPLLDLLWFAEREGARRGLGQPSIEAVLGALNHAGQSNALSLRHVVRMLERAEAMEGRPDLH